MIKLALAVAFGMALMWFILLVIGIVREAGDIGNDLDEHERWKE